MDIDSITTQAPSPPRKLLPTTGLPRDPNFVSAPVKEVEMTEAQAAAALPSPPVVSGHVGPFLKQEG
ncbi:unnamed protein product [Parascedosporium putredinis]|uniref:Uncharacterized protein n=1 Tax=Parascedosporium putredinis TaxID=1442378 RepID=A0A9P1H970_9PEZI|nr:unnamed protein product [Parascedosporium putredinis]CAI8001386.1 unnamed protein product [Parascedosporium putredinis]